MTERRHGIAEWRAYWSLPIAAGLGYATASVSIYSLGPYIEPLSQSFGWSRTLVTSGLTLATVIQAVLSIPVGMAVDRFGPRKLGLAGVILVCLTFGLLATASGSTRNWLALWLLIALASAPAQATVWTSAVASRFVVSRGLAFGVTLCGASVAATLFPALAAWLIEEVGWRQAVIWQSGMWLAVSFPIIFLFFRSARDMEPTADIGGKMSSSRQNGVALSQGFRSSVYHRLFVASLFFTFTAIGLVVHFVPILMDAGVSALRAASIASLIGISSIIGRLCTGLLLDRFPGEKVGALVFVLPAVAAGLLLEAGHNPVAQGIAALMIGLALGAEVDVVAYLAVGHFGPKNFGSLFGGLLVALFAGVAFGPLVAAQIFDRSNSYDPFLWSSMVLMAFSCLLLASLPHHDRRRYSPSPQ